MLKTPEYSVKSVEVIPPYGLKMSFADGSVKVLDMTPLLNEKPYIPLKNPGLFKQARTFCGTVVWTDEIDIAPEYLYENGTPCTE